MQDYPFDLWNLQEAMLRRSMLDRWYSIAKRYYIGGSRFGEFQIHEPETSVLPMRACVGATREDCVARFAEFDRWCCGRPHDSRTVRIIRDERWNDMWRAIMYPEARIVPRAGDE